MKVERVCRLEVKYNDFKELVNEFYEEMIYNKNKANSTDNELIGKIELKPKIIFDEVSNCLKVEFYIFYKTQSYKIQDLSEIYQLFCNHGKYKYSNSLEIVHEERSFKNQSKPILNFMLKYAELSKAIKNSMNINQKYLGKDINNSSIILSSNAIDEIFAILENEWVQLEMNGKDKNIQILNQNPDINPEIHTLLDDFVKMQEDSVEKLKTYL